MLESGWVTGSGEEGGGGWVVRECVAVLVWSKVLATAASDDDLDVGLDVGLADLFLHIRRMHCEYTADTALQTLPTMYSCKPRAAKDRNY